MKNCFKSKKGQQTAVEYTITFFLVIAAIMAMSTYVKRVLQARTRDAVQFMKETVKADYTGTAENFYFQYEPYYAMSNVERVVDSQDVYSLGESFPLSSGVFTHEANQTMTSDRSSVQLPPSFAD